MTIKSRHIYLAIGIGSIAVLAVNIMYFQDYLGLRPYSLCVLQRIAYLLIAVTALAAVPRDPRRRQPALADSLLLAWSVLGVMLAGWQIWFNYSQAAAECSIGAADKFLQVLPLAKWWPAMFASGADCAKHEWTLLQLSIPDLSMIAFVAIAVLSIVGAKRKRRESARMMFS
ncbi:disulfide bond formation protein B [Undibacterium sp.]|jgi:disulfide bond formation protein DsbB|uniref:disulfide bond formation protein B n=1 Tax=Undibacterium sp. TaxID=1914977 RepID=UPI002CC3D847|nr:disulfide bond formation protein B [Undibacterium sp.]HTD05717.1 disulfide bond formation protein B [Undibacterium sp.]